MSNIRLLRVLTEDGNPTGLRLTEEDVHQGDHWHSCVSVCVTDGRGNVYQQSRGYTTAIAPGKYDMFLASDHVVHTDEALAQTVERALAWRVGVKVPGELLQSLEPVLVSRSEYWVPDNTFPSRNGHHGYWHRAFEYIYVIRLPGLGVKTPFKFQEGRVLGTRLYPVSQLHSDFYMRQDSPEYTQHMHRPPNDEYILRAVYGAVMGLMDV